jgi:Asp-tRNA(Asn)/Glu-tRNA(Gln) amidotransferase A subunit family amidase
VELFAPRSLADDAAALRSGAVDLLDYVAACCARIDAVEPSVLALVDEPGRTDRLLAEAGELRSRFPAGAARPPLYGVPVAVKDVFHVDGFQTRAGSRFAPETLAGPETPAVTRLRRAGALVLGKSVTTEFAFFAPGPTRNPLRLDHTPGGSSSGSAAAVAAGMSPVALGTQTIGSTVRPAAYCGVVGFKPGFGRVPIDGMVANAPSFDTAGVFTADVPSAALAAAVLCDGWRPAADRASDRASDRAARLPRLGVPDERYVRQASGPAVEEFERQVERLVAAGYRVRRTTALRDIETVNRRHRLINLFELARGHADRFARDPDSYAPQTAEGIREGQAVPPAGYEQALRDRDAFRAGLAAATEAAEIDVWISPAATGPAPAGLGYTGDPVMNVPWTQAGTPVVGVPAGRSGGLPLGLQLAAAAGADEPLLAWARRVEQVLG